MQVAYLHLHVYTCTLPMVECILYEVFVTQVYTWLTDCGWAFMVDNAFIGENASETQSLIQRHDTFEAEAKVRYTSVRKSWINCMYSS